MSVNDMMKDAMSEIGKAYHTPASFILKGSKYNKGTKISNCLERDRKILLLTMPTF